MSSPFEMMRRRRKGADGAALDRVRAWTQARFHLTDDETVTVSEVACAVPGCPPIETHIVFWTDQGRHHFKVFKPLADVGADDLPPAFMKNALIWAEGLECSCC
jgi:nitrate reductase delta subunit